MVAIIFLKSELKTLEWHLFCFVRVLIAIHLLNNKFHVIFLWRLCITLVWPRGSQKLPNSAPTTDRTTIWRHFTKIKLCLGFLFIISIATHFQIEIAFSNYAFKPSAPCLIQNNDKLDIKQRLGYLMDKGTKGLFRSNSKTTHLNLKKDQIPFRSLILYK